MILLAGCTEPGDPAPPATVEAFTALVPGTAMPPEVTLQDAINNLDVVVHEGRTFLAFRTAPTHFASPDVVMYVVSSDDEQTWRYEGEIALGTDVREPQLVSWDGELWLWYAVLGLDPADFEPQGTFRTRRLGPGSWTEPVAFELEGFIPWRIQEVDGRLHLTGYDGGENIYDADGEPIRVHWLASDDGETWTAAVPGQPIVLEGGASETDFAMLDDGSLVAVSRNEAGDPVNGFGSLVCRAPAEDLGAWSCRADPRKYDSPLVFRRDGRVWLVARRNVTETGAFDLGMDELSMQERFLTYSVAYWDEPKRCALWEVDPVRIEVRWVLDLPSKGDTCFPEAVEGDGAVVVYNYSSDPDGPDWTWLEGQTRPTGLYRMELRGL